MLGAGPGMLYVRPGSPRTGALWRRASGSWGRAENPNSMGHGEQLAKAPSGRYPGRIEAAL